MAQSVEESGKKQLPSLEEVRKSLAYNPGTGEFTRVRDHLHSRAGKPAGGVRGNGYVYVGACGKAFLAHRLAWLFAYGSWPESHIDHINCDKTDNRIENLRAVTRSENLQNLRQPHCDNRSGYLGVYRDRTKWVASIGIGGGKRGRLGRFETPELAHAAYVRAKRVLHAGCTL